MNINEWSVAALLASGTTLVGIVSAHWRQSSRIVNNETEIKNLTKVELEHHEDTAKRIDDNEARHEKQMDALTEDVKYIRERIDQSLRNGHA